VLKITPHALRLTPYATNQFNVKCGDQTPDFDDFETPVKGLGLDGLTEQSAKL